MSPNQIYNETTVEGLWRETFGSAVKAYAVNSETDAIFRMSMIDGSGDFLLRISDDASGSLRFQAALLAHVEATAADLPVPRVLHGLAGNNCIELPTTRGHQHVAIAVTFMPGKPLAMLPSMSVDRAPLFKQLSRLDMALSGFDHPEARREILWDVSRADKVLPMVAHIPDRDLRELARSAILDWKVDIEPILGSLRRQVIHNDFNPSNILLDDDGDITGIIDFGDAICAPLICELATAAAYQEAPDGFSAMLALAARAYGEHVPLTEQELALLSGLVRARSAMVAAIAHWRSAQTPGNRAYLLRNVPAASRLLAAAACEPRIFGRARPA